MNPFDYETLSVLMKEYRDCNDIKGIRDTWNYILEHRPLDAREWREWIADDLESVSDLYKRATQDSVDVELWEEYLDYLQSDLGQSDLGAELIRAINGPGNHFCHGQKIWSKYLSYLIDRYQPAQEENVRREFYKRAEMLMNDSSFDSLLVLYSGFETRVGTDYESKMKKFNGIVYKQRMECKKRDVYESKLLEVFRIV
jgi:hypothetical protein